MEVAAFNACEAALIREVPALDQYDPPASTE
jgi:hypothetical protein